MTQAHMQYGLGMAGAAIAATMEAISKEQQSVLYTMEARIAANKSQSETAQAGATATEEQYNENATATKDGAIGAFAGAAASTLCLVGSGASAVGANNDSNAVEARVQTDENVTNARAAPNTDPENGPLTRAEANTKKTQIESRSTTVMQMWNQGGTVLNSVASNAGQYKGAEHTAKAGGFDATSQLFSTAKSQQEQIASTETSLMSTFMSNAAANTSLLLTLAQYSAQ